MSNNISVKFVNMPTTIYGYTIKTPDDWYTIVLNARCSKQKNLETFKHECYHIENNDFDKEDVQEIEYNAHKRS